jgi:hypothetical protein
MSVPRTLLAFVIGFGAALAAGWGAFPRVLYSTKAQPVEFRHKTHAAKSGTAECDSCHALREDGAFAGIPGNQGCAGCHGEPMGTTKAEATLVNNYIKPNRETPWLVYARQPANVRFSHAIHTRRAGLKCERCHGPHGESDVIRAYQENRISGYSRDIWGPTMSRRGRAKHEGMKMGDCEGCHRERKVEAGCLGCHQ